MAPVTPHLLCMRLLALIGDTDLAASRIAEPVGEDIAAKLMREAADMLRVARKAIGPCAKCRSWSVCAAYDKTMIMPPGQC